MACANDLRRRTRLRVRPGTRSRTRPQHLNSPTFSQNGPYTLENAPGAAHNDAGFNRDTHLKIASFILHASLLLTATSYAANSSGTPERKLYKWVDEQGITHYGDQIPPEYAAKDREVVNAQGIEVDRLEAQKTPEQVAEEEKKKQDVLARANRDKNLLSTYGSVQEIERLRDQRISLLTDQIKVTTQFLEILNGKMARLSAASIRFKPYSSDPKAPPMTDQMAEDLVHVGNDIHTQENNLREKRSEVTTMTQEFDSDIVRYKELKGIH